MGKRGDDKKGWIGNGLKGKKKWRRWNGDDLKKMEDEEKRNDYSEDLIRI